MSTWAHYNRVQEKVIICLRGSGGWDVPGERCWRWVPAPRAAGQHSAGTGDARRDGCRLSHSPAQSETTRGWQRTRFAPDPYPSMLKACSPCWVDNQDFQQPRHRALQKGFSSWPSPGVGCLPRLCPGSSLMPPKQLFSAPGEDWDRMPSPGHCLDMCFCPCRSCSQP